MANVSQRSFSAGELSPAMYARTDLTRYATGLRTLRNAVVLRTGGVQSRPGTEYLGATKNNGAARLVPAVFDTDASYVLEFGNLYVRFWENGELVRIAAPSAWQTATPYTIGTLREESGVNYLCIEDHTSGTFATDLAAGKWYALTDDIYEWPTPYLTAQLFDLQFAYQLNVVTIVHPSHPPATLTRTSDADWELADISFSLSFDAVANIAVSGTGGSGWGYTVVAEFGSGYSVTVGPSVAIVRTNQTETQITAYNLAMQSSPRTVTWNAVTGATGYSVYVNRVEGEVLYVQRVGAVTTFVDNGNWSAASTSSYSSYASRLAAAAPFGSAGEYPGVVGAYQQRLLLSGSVEEPDIVRASSVAEPYDFFTSDPIVDSDSLEWRQVGRRLNRVRHFVEAAQRLFQFSDIGESIIQGDTDGVLRPGEVNPRQFSENGAAVRPAPLVVNDTALYVQARGSMVRDLAPIQVGGFAGSDLTLQAAHLVDGYELVDWCYQQTPHSVVWAVRDDGVLLSLTYVRELGILGWAHHDTLGEVESVCCVPEGTLDAVYAVVNRATTTYDTTLGVTEGTITATEYNEGGYDAGALVTLTATSAPTVATGDEYAPDPLSGDAGVQVVAGATLTEEYAFLTTGWWRLVESNANEEHYVDTTYEDAPEEVPLAIGDTLCVEFLAQADGRNGIAFFVQVNYPVGAEGNLYQGVVDLTDGSLALSNWVSSVADPAPTPTITDELNGVYRIRVEIPNPAGLAGYVDYVTFLAADPTQANIAAATNYAGNGTNAVRVRWITPSGPFTANSVGQRIETDGGMRYFIREYVSDTVAIAQTEFDVDPAEQDTAVEPYWWMLPTDTSVRYVERLTDRLADSPVLMDSSLTLANQTTSINGLDHLEGQAVSVVGDGEVIASPNNTALPILIVDGGNITVPAAYDSVTIGLPYTTDIQTLDIDGAASSRLDSGINVVRIGLWLEDSIPPFLSNTEPTGDTVTTMNRMPTTDGNGNITTGAITGYREAQTDGAFTRGGRIFLRQVDPSPLTVLAIVPQGTIGRS